MPEARKTMKRLSPRTVETIHKHLEKARVALNEARHAEGATEEMDRAHFEVEQAIQELDEKYV